MASRPSKSHQRAYVTGRLEDSGRQNGEKMSRETVHFQSYATFFRHSAVLLRKLAIRDDDGFENVVKEYYGKCASTFQKQNWCERCGCLEKKL